MQYVINADGSSSGNSEMEQHFAEVLKEMFDTFCKKQKSYGRGNISQFGEKGVLIRSSDKLERLKRLVWNGVENPLANEGIEDTWIDLAVYSAIALLCRRGKWI